MRRGSKRDLVFVTVCIIIISMICCGCRSTKSVEEVVRTDTIRETETVVEYVPDTIYVEVPAQEKECTTLDSTSYLETDYAESTARINLNGTLFHELRNKAGKRAVETKIKVVTNKVRLYVNHDVVRRVTIEKKLSFWQRIAIRCFPWLLVALAGLGLWTFKIPILRLLSKVV